MTTSFERSPQRWLRLGGALYLAIILLGLFGEVLVRGSLVVPGNAQATLDAIRQSPLLWRLGIAGDLLMHVLDIPVMLIPEATTVDDVEHERLMAIVTTNSLAPTFESDSSNS